LTTIFAELQSISFSSPQAKLPNWVFLGIGIPLPLQVPRIDGIENLEERT
jgi:hypothetical protein